MQLQDVVSHGLRSGKVYFHFAMATLSAMTVLVISGVLSIPGRAGSIAEAPGR